MTGPTGCQAIEFARPWLFGLALWITTFFVGCDGTGRLFAPSVEHYIGDEWPGEVVVLSGLRPCGPTQAWERPLLAQVVDAGGNELFRVPYSGIAFDDQRTFLPLYFEPTQTSASATSSSPGRREIRLWECAPLLDAAPPTHRNTTQPCSGGRQLRTIRVPGPRPDGKPVRRVYDIGLHASRCLERP